ncbi:hypothetical protein [Streptomyces sp. bgisy154]
MAWTSEQQKGQQSLNQRLNSARQAPVQGKPVPEKAKRNGQMDG